MTIGLDATADRSERRNPTTRRRRRCATGADDSTTPSHDDGESSSSDTGTQPGCADFDGRVIYMNMRGVELTLGLVDNAPANIIEDDYPRREWAGYTTDDADEVFALVEEHFSPFHVCLTREVPPVLRLLDDRRVVRDL